MALSASQIRKLLGLGNLSFNTLAVTPPPRLVKYMSPYEVYDVEGVKQLVKKLGDMSSESRKMLEFTVKKDQELFKKEKDSLMKQAWSDRSLSRSKNIKSLTARAELLFENRINVVHYAGGDDEYLRDVFRSYLPHLQSGRAFLIPYGDGMYYTFNLESYESLMNLFRGSSEAQEFGSDAELVGSLYGEDFEIMNPRERTAHTQLPNRH